MARSVPSVEGAFLGPFREPLADSDVGSELSELSDWRAVMRVLTTQIGFVISTVADPAMAPAIMDSRVVSFSLARPALRAARSKVERVHSYPFPPEDMLVKGWFG